MMLRTLGPLLLSVIPLARSSGPPPAHEVLSYDLTVIVGDSTGHIVGQAEIVWRIGSAEPLRFTLDSALRLVRVIVLGAGGGRRGGWGRLADTVFVPHDLAVGDTMVTRIRFHGVPPGGTGPAGCPATAWLPLPLDCPVEAPVLLHVEVPPGVVPIATGMPQKVDTLAYGRTITTFKPAEPIGLGDIMVEVRR